MTAIFQGKVALVTGGSRGIGAATALRLAREGADVAFTYVNSAERAGQVAKEIEAMGVRALAIRANAESAADSVAAVRCAVTEFGRLDILVNNAGIGVMAPLRDLTLDQIDRTLAVNVRSVLLTTQAAAAHLRRGGRVITIGSCVADRVPGAGATLYAMSKSALIGLTKALARELGDQGVTANIIHPGPIDTDMNPADGPAADFQRGMLPLGRFGTPDDIAATVVHLAGEGGRYITGAVVSVDGGHAA